MPGDALSDLTDALARGRLTVAEVAAISPSELEALFELGALRLDTGRDTSAVTIFAGLVSLFPYAAKYWRAYGIALHRLLELDRARAAYDASLLLEPDHPETLCYRGEICLYQGDLGQAVEDLGAVIQTEREDLTRRATALLECVEGVAVFSENLAVAHPEPVTLGAEESFTLADGRSLPLAESSFDDEEEEEPEVTSDINPFSEPLPEEVTQTAQAYVPEVADLWEPAPLGDEEVTATLSRAGPTALFEEATKTQPLRDITGTLRPLREMTRPLAPIPQEPTETALIPGRPRALALEREARRLAAQEVVPPPVATDGAGRSASPVGAPAARAAAAPPREITQTAIVRRRLRQPLCAADREAEDPEPPQI